MKLRRVEKEHSKRRLFVLDTEREELVSSKITGRGLTKICSSESRTKHKIQAVFRGFHREKLLVE